ncbi:hypothetical protein WR25_20531 [Diploscapter pachys]|uniref:Peptidase S54 rhomboid domain-containing protein n=1 Tax=Diploscapter pachys TaxID=2018661 RepID=A0A2A2KC39_9BILA|nr:hypothetical protein WR25_20531 [Diploscapter pachys]
MTMRIDLNGDRLIDFSEFCFIMSQTKNYRLRHAMFLAAASVVPKSRRTEPFAYLQQYKCCPPPLFMIIISIIQIGVYLYYVLDSQEGFRVDGPVPTLSPIIFNPHHRDQLWRYLTYSLIHIGYYHLIFNVLTQLLLGLPLELVHQWRVVVVYVMGVICGSLLVSAVDPTVYLAGASGGVYALLAAHFSELIMNWSEVSYIAHIGGFVAGLFVGVIFLRNFKRRSFEKIIWWTSLVAIVLFILICLMVIFGPALFVRL